MKKAYSKKKITDILKNLSGKLGKQNLSGKEIATVIPKSTVNSYFGSIGSALEAAGLEKRKPGYNFKGRKSELTDKDLSQNLLCLEGELKREPRYYECRPKGEYSTTPYKTRFGKWEVVLRHYKKWKIDNQIANIAGSSQTPFPNNNAKIVTSSPSIKKVKKTEQLYGEPMEFRGLRHAPINEQGVVFLFGMICREIGFNIEAIQQGYPDCEGKYLL